MAFLPVLSAAGCLATPVQGDQVRVGPFVGYIVHAHDVVDGRFRLHVGAYRNRATALSQRIPWFLPGTYRVSSVLRVTGRRVGRRRRTFTETFAETFAGNRPDRHVFPSNIEPPAAGCWRLTFRTGRVTGRLTVLLLG
jgi:hypothetical protein